MFLNYLKWLKTSFPFVEGASIHRPHIFSVISYQFWKIRMKMFIESIDQVYGMQS